MIRVVCGFDILAKDGPPTSLIVDFNGALPKGCINMVLDKQNIAVANLKKAKNA